MINILVVDDDKYVRKILNLALEKKGGFNIIEQTNAISASAFLNNPNNPTIDIIILDICMPITSGIQLYNWIRSDHSKTIPIIMISAMDDHELSSSSDKFLTCMTKPFKFDKLFNVLSNTYNYDYVI